MQTATVRATLLSPKQARRPTPMEFEFPPMPPDYPRVIAVRLILLAWALVGLGIVIGRLRHWKSVRPGEIPGWIAAAVVSGDRRVAWDQAPNFSVAQTRCGLYVCPSCYVPQNAVGQWYSAYSMLTGPGTVGDAHQGTAIKDITDGISNTLMIVEACGSQIVWTEPRDVKCAVQPTGINLNGTRPGESSGWMSSYHSLGAMGLMVDGSVRFLSADTDPDLLRKLATINGGELIEE